MYLEEKVDLTFHLKKLKSRKHSIILLSLSIMFILIIGNSLVFPDTYTAKALVRITPDSLESSVSGDPFANMDTVKIFKDEILSRSILIKVVNQLNLTEKSEPGKILKILNTFGLNLKQRPITHTEVMTFLSKKVSITKEENNSRWSREQQDDIFSVEMSGKDPSQIAEIVNAIVTTYIDDIRHKEVEKSIRHVKFLETQVNNLKNQVNMKSQQINMFNQQYANVFTLGDTIATSLHNAKMSLILAEGRVRESEEHVANIRTDLKNEPIYQNNILPVGEDTEILDPHEKLRLLKRQLANATVRFTDDHPIISKLKTEISFIQSEIDLTKGSEQRINPEYAQLRRELNQSLSTLKSAKTQVVKIQNEIVDLTSKSNQLPQLKEILDSLRTNRNALQIKLNEISSTLQKTKILTDASINGVNDRFNIIDYAISIPTTITTSRFKINILCIIIGLIFGTLIIGAASSFELINEDSRSNWVVYPTSIIMFMFLCFYILNQFISSATL